MIQARRSGRQRIGMRRSAIAPAAARFGGLIVLNLIGDLGFRSAPPQALRCRALRALLVLNPPIPTAAKGKTFRSPLRPSDYAHHLQSSASAASEYQLP